MRFALVAIGLLFYAGMRGSAQGADSGVGRVAPEQSTSGAGTGTVPQVAGQEMDGAVPTCWLGCRGSLHVLTPTEWAKTEQVRQDMRKLHPDRPAKVGSTRADESRSKGAAADAAPAQQGDSAAGPTNPHPATEAEGQRYLIEEWRRSELEVADSIHHAVLLRVAHVFDSAQRSSPSSDGRFQLLREIDGINAANQIMWFQRRAEVDRVADSTERAAGLTPTH